MMFSPDNLTVAPWAHLDLLVAVVGALGLIGSSAGFWEWRKFRRKQKISAEEHEQAAAARAVQQAVDTPAEELVTAAMTIVGKWEEMVASITERHEKEMEKRDRRHAADIKTLNKRVDQEVKRRRRFETTIHEWWDGIRSDWERVRQDPYAPNFPTINYDEDEEV